MSFVRWRVVAALVLLPGCNTVLAFHDVDAADADADSVADADALETADIGATSCVVAGCGTSEWLHCNPDSGQCEQCLRSGDCPYPLQYCDPLTHACLECNSPSDCPPPSSCIVSAHKCVRECPPTGGKCPPTSVCDVALDICRFCSNDSQCLEPRQPNCNADIGECVECTKNVHCPPDHPICDPASFRCVQCVHSAECPVGMPICDPEHHRCVTR
jgi:hypothetical protein